MTFFSHFIGHRQLVCPSPKTTGHHVGRLPDLEASSTAGRGLAAAPLAFRGSSRRGASLIGSGGADRTAGRGCGLARATRPPTRPHDNRTRRLCPPVSAEGPPLPCAVQSAASRAGTLGSCWAILRPAGSWGRMRGEVFTSPPPLVSIDWLAGASGRGFVSPSSGLDGSSVNIWRGGGKAWRSRSNGGVCGRLRWGCGTVSPVPASAALRARPGGHGTQGAPGLAARGGSVTPLCSAGKG